MCVCVDVDIHTYIHTHIHYAGWDATRTIRQLEKDRGEKYPLCIVGVIGASTPSEADKCMESGMTDTIMKPINRNTLMKGVYRYVRMRARARVCV